MRLRLLCILSGSSLFGQNVITTFAGSPKTFLSLAASAAIASPIAPTRIATAPNGTVYFGDREANLVWRLNSDGSLTVVAGNGLAGFSGDGGPATAASFFQPAGLAVDNNGNIYIADVVNQRVRKVDTTGVVTTVAGTGQPGYSGDGGPAVAARLNFGQTTYTVSGHTAADYAGGLAVDRSGNLYIPDFANNVVRRVDLTGTITTIAGNGSNKVSGDGGAALAAGIPGPTGVAIDNSSNFYIVGAGTGEGVRRVAPNGTITTIVSGTITAVSVDGAGNVYGAVPFATALSFSSGSASAASAIIRVSASGATIIVAGGGAGGFSGDGGPAATAKLNSPWGVAIDAQGNIFIADEFNERIREINSAGIITTVAGTGFPNYFGDNGPATSSGLGSPNAVVVDQQGNTYIADNYNERIRKVDSKGTITTFADFSAPSYTGDPNPKYLALAPDGSVFVNGGTSKNGAAGILKISPSGQVAIAPGNSQISGVQGLASDGAGNLYVLDGGLTVRKIDVNGNVSTPGGGVVAACRAYLHQCIATDNSGNVLIPGGTTTTTIVKISPAGVLTSIPVSPASQISGIAADAANNIYIADVGTHDQILKVAPNGSVTVYAGNNGYGYGGDGGLATLATMFGPVGLTFDGAGDLLMADSFNNRIREVLAAPATLTVSPTGLVFSASAGGIAPAPQSINLSSSLAGLFFSASVSDSWLTVTPASGLAPAVLQVSVDPSELSAQSYTGSVTITAPGTTQTVSVSFNVTQATPGKLGVSAPSLSFSAAQGSAASSTQLSVSNQGGGSIAVAAVASTSTGGTWLQVSPASGYATPSNAVPLTVTATPGSLAAGTYSGNIVVSSSTTGTSINVPVTLSVSAVQESILLSQTGLTFTAVAQGGAPLPQAFGILNTGQGSMAWSASAQTLSNGPWLSIDQSGGSVTTPYTDVSLVNVSVNAAGLPPGNYYGQIQVMAPGAPNSPQFVSVSLNVLPAGSSPGAEVRPTGLIFIGQPGSSPGSQNVMIANPQSSGTTFAAGFLTVPTGGNWAQVLPLNATVQPNSPVSMLVQPDYTSLTSGVYPGFVYMGFADGTSRSVHVLAVVAPAGASASVAASDGTPLAQASGSCSPIRIQPISLTDPGSSVTIGVAASLQVRAVDSCGNVVTSSNGSVVAAFNDGDASVNLVHEGNGNWSGTWTPRNGVATQVQVNYTGLEGSGVSLLAGTANITVAVKPPTTAPLTFGAANSASGLGAYISPGGLVSIYGQQLANQPVTSGNPPFPTNINGTQVLLGGIALPLRYIGSGQVNAQVPFALGINTQQQLIVQNGNALSVPQSVVVAAAQPGIYTQDQSGNGPGVVVDGNTNIEVTAKNPAHIGDTLVIYCNGLGATSPAVPTGTPAPSVEPLARTANTTAVTIGGVNAIVAYAGLAPGFPDLYQVNAQIPLGVTPGPAVPVVLTVAGQNSPANVTIAVQ